MTPADENRLVALRAGLLFCSADHRPVIQAMIDALLAGGGMPEPSPSHPELPPAFGESVAPEPRARTSRRRAGGQEGISGAAGSVGANVSEGVTAGRDRRPIVTAAQEPRRPPPAVQGGMDRPGGVDVLAGTATSEKVTAGVRLTSPVPSSGSGRIAGAAASAVPPKFRPAPDPERAAIDKFLAEKGARLVMSPEQVAAFLRQAGHRATIRVARPGHSAKHAELYLDAPVPELDGRAVSLAELYARANELRQRGGLPPVAVPDTLAAPRGRPA